MIAKTPGIRQGEFRGEAICGSFCRKMTNDPFRRTRHDPDANTLPVTRTGRKNTTSHPNQICTQPLRHAVSQASYPLSLRLPTPLLPTLKRSTEGNSQQLQIPPADPICVEEHNGECHEVSGHAMNTRICKKACALHAASFVRCRKCRPLKTASSRTIVGRLVTLNEAQALVATTQGLTCSTRLGLGKWALVHLPLWANVLADFLAEKYPAIFHRRRGPVSVAICISKLHCSHIQARGPF